MARSVPKPLSKRLVFENDYVEGLAISYKRNRDFGTYVRICRHTKNLIDSIILGSRFNRTVPFHDLVSHLFLQMERWVLKWVPGQGTFYSYASTCIKHGSYSLLAKENQLRQRQVLAGDTPLESLGASYTMDFSGERDLVERVRAGVHTRWADPEIQEAIQYVVEEILASGGIRNRKAVVRTLEHAFDLGVHCEAGLGRHEPVEVAKFIVDWSSTAVRQAWLDHHASPVTAFDIVRLQSRYSFLPDLVSCIGTEAASKLMGAFAGVSLRIPTLAAWEKVKQVGQAYDEYMEDPGPEVVRTWAKKLRVSEDRLLGTIESWSSNAQAGVLEDVPLAS